MIFSRCKFVGGVFGRPVGVLLLAFSIGQLPTRLGADAASLAFFESKIRPLLVEHCYECHAEKKQKGGLRLDSREGWVRGGDSGPAIEPGSVDKSLIIKAVRYKDPDFQMPPKYKLSDAQIADLEKWVSTGADDPRTGSAGPTAAIPSLEKGKSHWAYQPAVKPVPPQVKNQAWVSKDIDRFILAKLEASGVGPGPDADKASLIRRLYFDVVGLPPTPDEVNAFVHDSHPDAISQAIKRLLDSSQFGERWGRHWLDVARFGESVTLRGFIFKEAWRYRDYVIQAFNADLPYHQFVREQIAGDLLPAEGSLDDRRRRQVAATFLMLGNTNLEEQDKKQLDMDVVDEQLDTLGKAFLAQTIGCARCHDHKFDPIPTADYYAMAGILRGSQTLKHANVSEWLEQRLPVESSEEAIYRESEKQMDELKKSIAEFKARLAKSGKAVASSPSPVAPSSLPGIVVDDSKAKRVGEWVHSTYSKNFVGDGYLHDGNTDKGTKTLTFYGDTLAAGEYEVRLAYVPSQNRTARLPVMILHAGGETTVEINQRETPPIDGRFISLGQFRFEANGQGYVLISNEGTEGHVIADAVQFLPVELKQSIPSAAKSSEEKVKSGETDELKRLEARLKGLNDSAPKYPMTMGLKERDDAADLRIHIRGSVHNLGELAPRGFLRVACATPAPKISAGQSGRKELAEWLASSTNPLTARVMANRVWAWVFGVGLVRTVDNFGTTGETPSHPELLDFLAVRLIEHGWSVKKLAFEIFSSHTYRLAVAAPPAADPENRLFSRANLRRLDAECIRDSILSMSGRLQPEMGGPTIKPGVASDFGYAHTDERRSVYLPVLRNSLPEMLEVFDFPDPSMVVGQRNVSSVAQQSLFLMNHPWVRAQARAAAEKILRETGSTDAELVSRAYQTAFSRMPSPKEQSTALKFVNIPSSGENTASERLEAWTELWQAIFASVDFRYLN